MKTKNLLRTVCILTSAICHYTDSISFAQSPANWQWVKTANGYYSGKDNGRSITHDASGNIYVTGEFNYTLTLGNFTIQQTGSYPDLFVAKLDSSGNPLWLQKTGGGYDDYSYAIAADGFGNVFVTGTSYNNSVFNFFIKKYDKNGNLLWTKISTGATYAEGREVVTDASGNCYVTGKFSGTATFGAITLTSSGSNDIFLAKYDVNGNVVWVKKAGGSSDDNSMAISMDDSANCYLTGGFKGIAVFGSLSLSSTGLNDIFIAKYDSGGKALWAKKTGGAGNEYSTGIAVNDSAIYLTGYFTGTTAIGTTSLTSVGSEDILFAKYDTGGNAVWAKQAGSSAVDRGNAIAVDSSNNVYVTGYFNGAAAFGANTLNSFGSDDIFIAQYNGNGNLAWVNQAGGTADDKAYSISADADGNCYFTGYIRDTVAFDMQIINSTKPREADIFIAKYNANGNVQLSQAWVGKQVTSIDASAIAEDATKNKYLGGAIYGVAFLGNDTLTSDYSSSLYLVKYDSGGNLIWVKQTGTGGPGATIKDIQLDSFGNIYITGNFDEGTIYFDNFSLTCPVTPNTFNTEIFIVKFDNNGNTLWAKKAGGKYKDYGYGIRLDKNANVYITGTVSDTAVFDNDTLITIAINPFFPNGDIFLAKYDSNGNLIWVKQAGGSQNDESRGLGMDSLGNCYLTGIVWDVATFDTISINTGAVNNPQIYIAKYNINGDIQWVKEGGSPGNNLTEYSYAIYTDPGGHSLITGNFQGTAVFSPYSITSAGGTFLVKYDASGNVLWAKAPGGGTGSSVAIDNFGNNYVTGYFTGTASFGSASLSSSGLKDIYLAKYDTSGNAVWAKKAGGKFDDYSGYHLLTGKCGELSVIGSVNDTASLDTITLTSGGFLFAKLSQTLVAAVTPIGPVSLCQGDSVLLTAAAVAAAYQWSNGATTQSIIVLSPGNYFVTITDTSGCSAVSSPATVTVNSLPSVSVTLNPDTVCINAGVYALTGGTPSGGTYSGIGVSGGNYAPSVAGAGLHTITYSFTGGNGCTDSASAQIFVDVCTEIQSVSDNQSIIISPNPTNGIITIRSSKNISTVEIINLLGEKIYSSKINFSETEIDLSKRQNGIYFLELKTGQDIARKKIVIGK